MTSPGPALPSEARLFIFVLTCNCPTRRALGPVQAAAMPNGKAAAQNDQRVPKEVKQQQIHSHGRSTMDFNWSL